MTRGRMLFLAAVLALTGCARNEHHDDHGHDAHGQGHEDEAPRKGPHGGRWLADGKLAVEVTIFERGVPPEFRVYAYENEAPLPPSHVELTIELRRFGGRVDTIGFAPREDYLLGNRTVDEPHAFDVVVMAVHDGATHRWEYESHEGRTTMSEAAVAASKIGIETVGPAVVRTALQATGRVVPNEDRLAHVVPRFPGIVKQVRKRLGETAAAGEVLAVVESNESLQAYDVKSGVGGTVIAKHVTPGEFAAEGEVIYTVADLSTVWVDLNVLVQDFARLRVGQLVKVEVVGGTVAGEGRIVYLSAFGAEMTQTLLARVEIANPDGHWRPGLFASAEIVVEEAEVPLAVRTSALQTFRGRDVVFVTDGTTFQAAPIELGRRDGAWAEVLGGLEGGERYAVENSFIVKADVGKSGASHDH
jgi:cobalt-zinc-cadmium efflux system membrane fusion protein